MLTHYRSPVDYNEDTITATEESIQRIFNSLGLIRESAGAKSHAIHKSSHTDLDFRKKSDELIVSFYKNLDSDLSTPEAIASLFSLLRLSNSHLASKTPDTVALAKVATEIESMLWILGIKEETPVDLQGKEEALASLLRELGEKSIPDSALASLDRIIELRQLARKKKDFASSDLIRKRLGEAGIVLEDKIEGVRWKIV
jgi:cysteinyl-tRNA synthetase